MKIRQIFLGVGLSFALVLSSCESVIDIEPEYAKEGAEIFNNLDEYEYALTGAYAQFRQIGYFGSGGQTTGTWSTLPDVMSDNLVQTGEDLGNWASQANWNYTSDESDIAIAWIAAYQVITQANLVLDGIDRFADENPERVNRIKGQALAIRAVAHFDLLRYWGEAFDRNSALLGVPYKTTVDKDDMPARLTVKETYDNILKDLNDAEALLGDVDSEPNTESSRSFIDLTTTRAILARVNLYAEEYAEAARYATLVIDEIPLASRAEFPAIWEDESVAEVIWAVSFNAGEGTPSGGVHNAPSNRNRFRPSLPLMETYAEQADVRYDSYFGTRSRADVERPIVAKFVGRGTATDNLVNWKVFRTGEMYLIRAEARAMLGDIVGALADLNALRAARIAGYVPVVIATQQALLDAIALERRKELFSEGHRWFDLKRTTRMIEREDCGTNAINCTLEPDAREWAWPIPQGELDANSNIRGQQNPGYSS
ncbi:RagB/SusD family nutrient uptake outer membrane protein [Pontibacter toksunensis]|uniref:RagB/SusD family nutrient uptake outer membrane protein n=1 Tax=Pontibacter toksunensis TaxID=1332631 RepID=A0ABW6BVE7_9BACT